MANKKENEYSVNSACVNCSRGSSKTTFLTARKGSYTGKGNVGIKSDTNAGKNFSGTFGYCRRLKAPCSPSFLPAWTNPSPSTYVRIQPSPKAYKLSIQKAIDATYDYFACLYPGLKKGTAWQRICQAREPKGHFSPFFLSKLKKLDHMMEKPTPDFLGRVDIPDPEYGKKILDKLQTISDMYIKNILGQHDVYSKAKKEINAAYAKLNAYKAEEKRSTVAQPVLMDYSKLACTKGGFVSFDTSGQKEFLSNKEVLNKDLPTGDMVILKPWINKTGWVHQSVSPSFDIVRRIDPDKVNEVLEHFYITKEIAEEHKIYNQGQSIPDDAIDSNGCIIAQSKMIDFKYGSKDLSYNGCGCIAAYNTCILLGDTPPELWEIVYYMENLATIFQGDIIKGEFGTFPWSVSKYLSSERGYKTTDNVFTAMRQQVSPPGVIKVSTPVYDKEWFLRKWTNASLSGGSNVMMYVGNKMNYGHFVAYQDNGTIDTEGDSEFHFYNDTLKHHSDDTVGSLRKFTSQSLNVVYHTSVTK